VKDEQIRGNISLYRERWMVEECFCQRSSLMMYTMRTSRQIKKKSPVESGQDLKAKHLDERQMCSSILHHVQATCLSIIGSSIYDRVCFPPMTISQFLRLLFSRNLQVRQFWNCFCWKIRPWCT